MNNVERSRALKALRVAAGLTQKQVADHFGIDKASVSEWERGGRPTIDKLPVLDEIYNANGEVLKLWGFVPRGDGPVDSSDTAAMLTEILSEIRTHRASDIAPSAHLLDMPTRAEFTAALKSTAATHGEEIDRLTKMVARLDEKVEELRGRSAAQEPPIAPAARRHTGTSASRTKSNAPR